jgi:hypothetical protein
MSQACATWRGEIGAYIVGALDTSAAAKVRRHLRRCRACRADYEDLLPVPRWLDRVPASDLPPPARPPGRIPALGHLPKPARAPEPARSLGRWPSRRWFIGAAAIVTLAAGAEWAQALAHPAGPSGSSRAAPPDVRAFDRTTGVRGWAWLRGTASGTQIELAISGLPAGELCTLVAVSTAGTAIAGTWHTGYNGTARVAGTSAIGRARLTALRVESPVGRVLLSLKV